MTEQSRLASSRNLCRAGALFVLLVFAAAQTASAGNVLFSGAFTALRPLPVNIDTIPASSPQTLMTTPGGLANGFTLPSKAFASSFSFTGVFPGYPFLFGSAMRYQKQGVFSASKLTPSASITFLPDNSVYPYATATPPPGFIRQKVGPNGFAGPMEIIKSTNYTGQFAAGAGFYDFQI